MGNWLILTGSGTAVRGRYQGTKAQVIRYCKDHYALKGCRIVKDTAKKLGSRS